MRTAVFAVSAALLLASSPLLAAEPWIDPDPAGPAERLEITDTIGIRADAEYRAQMTFVNPIAVNSETNRRFHMMEHRGRIGMTVDHKELVKLRMSLDLLDGVLWGDNGTFGGDPSSDAGLQITTRDPNVVKPCITFIGGNPLSPDGYGYGLCDADPIKVRRLWAQVSTPVGVLRVGRQPSSLGTSVQTASGDGRTNRFGVSYEGDSVDRVLFATKPLEAFKPKDERSTSEHEGFIMGVFYDRWASDSVSQLSQAFNGIGYVFRYLQPDFGIGQDLELQAFHVHRWDGRFETRINIVGGRALARFGGLSVGVDAAANIGTTQEVSSAYAVVTNDPVVDQDVLQFGGRAVARYDWRPNGSEEEPPMLSGYFELDYASGDDDPEAGTPLTQFRFSEDTNVGLLLFEHVLRYSSARAGASGTEIIRRLGAETFPAERVHTRGSFTNALAIFPQVDFRPHESLLLRAGVLVAWSPQALVDPVASLQGKDGNTIADDLVNYVGGPPGDFFGTELDGRIQYKLFDHFALDFEAAVLFPGDALKDINGQAVTSFLTQGRTTFYY